MIGRSWIEIEVGALVWTGDFKPHFVGWCEAGIFVKISASIRQIFFRLSAPRKKFAVDMHFLCFLEGGGK